MKQSQTSSILAYMLEGNTITSAEAFSMFGATRLSAIIFKLRDNGYEIECERETVTNRYGGTSNYGVYKLVGVPEGVEM